MSDPIRTVYVLVEIAISPWLTERVTLADTREFATLQACQRARPDIGVFGVLDQRVLACRRVNK